MPPLRFDDAGELIRESEPATNAPVAGASRIPAAAPAAPAFKRPRTPAPSATPHASRDHERGSPKRARFFDYPSDEDRAPSVSRNGKLPPSPGFPTATAAAAAAANGIVKPNANGVIANGHVHAKGKQKAKSHEASKAARKARAEALFPSRQELPVYSGRAAIVKEVMGRDTVIVLGETGSGKTTQIPQYLLSHGSLRSGPLLRIAVTQPRRVAAISLASRVAEEVGCQLGSTVGYTVRFDDVSSRRTRLKFLTDGTLLQELLGDRWLAGYDVVVLDEAHERTLRTDMLMGFLKQVQAERSALVRAGAPFPPAGGENGRHGKWEKEEGEAPEMARPLRIVVMSATLDAQRFSQFFNDAKVLYVKGRQHPVTIQYAEEPVQDFIEGALLTILNIHARQPPGDILVFLTGEEDIESLNAQLKAYIDDMPSHMFRLLVCPLYAKLNPTEQQRAFQLTPPRTRKVVLATNVAETSITISGIKHVIDCGLAKIRMFHHAGGVEELAVRPVSKSSAQQRGGRAGREAPGTCWRLYTQQAYNELEPAAVPEIQRCSFMFTALHLLAAGVEDVTQFPFMDVPKLDDVRFALMHLAQIGAVEASANKQRITPLGRRMASLPLDPPYARALLASIDHGCAVEVIALLALLESADTLLHNSPSTRDAAAEARCKYVHREGDHLTLLNLLRGYEAAEQSGGWAEAKRWCQDHYVSYKAMGNVTKARRQLEERCDRLGLDRRSSCGEESEPVLKSLLRGMVTKVGLRQEDGTYRGAWTKLPMKIHPSSSLIGRGVNAVLFHELVATTAIYGRTCSRINPMWLTESDPPGHQPYRSNGDAAA